MINEADMDGDGLVSLQEFINVMNSAHNSNNNDIEHYSAPRILKNSEELQFEPSSSYACCNDTEDEDDDARFENNSESKNDNSAAVEINPSKSNENEISLPQVNKNTGSKRRKSIIDWLKGSSKDFDQIKFSETSSEALSSSACSLASSEEPSISAIPAHLQSRRRSSISKTLKNGKDALVATAKRIRKLSR